MARKANARREPPEHLSDDVAAVWRELVDRDAVAPDVDVVMLEVYCALIVRHRAATEALASEGIVVDGGERRGAIVHPALAAERDLAEQIRRWSPVVMRRASAVRKAGPMYNATKKSVAASDALKDNDQFAGAVEAVITLAWLIDEAQRAGIEALQKASFVMIPSYLKGCAELQITPASLPEGAQQKGKGGGKVTKFQDAAEARRRRAAG